MASHHEFVTIIKYRVCGINAQTAGAEYRLFYCLAQKAGLLGMRIFIEHRLEISLYAIVKYRLIVVFIAPFMLYQVYHLCTLGLVEY